MKTVSAVSKAYRFQSLIKWLVWFMGDYRLFQQFFQSYHGTNSLDIGDNL
jgi:hypothetical protein